MPGSDGEAVAGAKGLSSVGVFRKWPDIEDGVCCLLQLLISLFEFDFEEALFLQTKPHNSFVADPSRKSLQRSTATGNRRRLPFFLGV